MNKKLQVILCIVMMVFITLGFTNVIPIGIGYFIGFVTLGISFIIKAIRYKKDYNDDMFWWFIVCGIIDIGVGIVHLLKNS